MVTLLTEFDRLMLLGEICEHVREGFRSEFAEYKIKSEHEPNIEMPIALWTNLVTKIIVMSQNTLQI